MSDERLTMDEMRRITSWLEKQEDYHELVWSELLKVAYTSKGAKTLRVRANKLRMNSAVLRDGCERSNGEKFASALKLMAVRAMSVADDLDESASEIERLVIINRGAAVGGGR